MTRGGKIASACATPSTRFTAMFRYHSFGFDGSTRRTADSCRRRKPPEPQANRSETQSSVSAAATRRNEIAQGENPGANTVDRFRSPEGAKSSRADVMRGDQAQCLRRKVAPFQGVAALVGLFPWVSPWAISSRPVGAEGPPKYPTSSETTTVRISRPGTKAWRLMVCLLIMLAFVTSTGCIVPAGHGQSFPLAGGHPPLTANCGCDACDGGGGGWELGCDSGCGMSGSDCQAGCGQASCSHQGCGAFFNDENGGIRGICRRFCSRLKGCFTKDQGAEVPWPRYHPVPSRPVFSGLPVMP